MSAPAAGAVLAGGSTAELAWEPGPGFERLAGAHEWEAFLSVDGGKTYAFRLTPHLDLDVRRFRWEVPRFPTEDARLLLRVGDEESETAIQLPLRFAITGPAGALPSFDPELQAELEREAEREREREHGLTAAAEIESETGLEAEAELLTFEPGEAALPGASGVISWVEGDRRGAATRRVTAVPLAGLRSGTEPLAEGHRDVGFTLQDPLPNAAALRLASGLRLPVPVRPPALLAPPSARRGPPADLLLLHHRRNE
jgi:hypothetical protein